jgi:hypothetical protein
MKSSTNHYPSLLAALLFVVAAMLFLSVALIMFASALADVFSGENVQARQTILVATSFFEAVILVLATYVAVQRYRQQAFVSRDASFTIGFRAVAISLLITGILVFLGHQWGETTSINWLVLPLLTVPAVLLPIFVILGLGVRHIPLGTRWQSWGIFGVAMTLSPFLLAILEVIVLLIVVFLMVAILMSQPNFANEMQHLLRQLAVVRPQPEEMQNLLLPYLAHPAIIGIALSYFSLLVPMIEELLKPLGVWISANRISSPAQGFALGALSGAAYALIETLGVSAQTVDWANLLLSRIGTDVLHITTSALMGAAIIYAFREKRFLRLAGTYILAVSLHGLWNGLAILYSYSVVTDSLGKQNALTKFQTPVIIAMVALAIFIFGILLLSNRRMRATLPSPVPQEPVP